jgi:hypothetical protein
VTQPLFPERATDHNSPLTDGLQSKLLEALSSGLKPRYVALSCGVAPKTLYAWLDSGAKRDALQPYRAFTIAWVQEEARLQRRHLEIWQAGGFGAKESQQFLERRWPHIWGKDAQNDYEPLQPQASNAEELEHLELILEDPAAYGLLELFAKHDRLTTKERAQLAAPPALPG